MIQTRLRTAVGISRGAFDRPRDAARKAAEQALSELGSDACAILVFGAPQYEGTSVLAGIKEVAGHVPLAGASSALQVANEVFDDALVVLAIDSPHLELKVASTDHFWADPCAAIDALLEEVVPAFRVRHAQTGPMRAQSDFGGGFLLALLPPTTLNESKLLGMQKGVERFRARMHRVHAVFGFGAVGSGNARAWQLANDRCIHDGLVLAFFRTALEFGIGFAHGLVNEDGEDSHLLRVTRASKGIATEINERPVREILDEQLLPTDQNGLIPPVLYRPHGSIGPALPIRLLPVGDNRDRVVAHVPLTAEVEISQPMIRARRLVESASRAVGRSLGEPTVRTPRLSLVIGARWRCDRLAENCGAEVEAACHQLPDATVVGLYTDNIQLILGRGYEACCDGIFGALTIGDDLSSLYEAESRSVRLLEAAREILEALGPQAVFQKIADAAYRILECKSCTLRLLDKENERLVLKAVRGVTEGHHKERYPEIARGKSVVGKAVAEGRRVIEPALLESSVYATPELAKEYALGALVCEPVMSNGTCIGALSVYYGTAADITPERLEIAAALCDMVSAAVIVPRSVDDVDDLCRALGQLADRDTAAQLIAARTRRILNCNVVEVHCQDQSLRMFTRSAYDGDDIDPDLSPSSLSARERAIEERHLAIVAEPPGSFFGAGLAASAPILAGNEVLAVITALWKRAEDASPSTSQSLELVAARTAPQLQNIVLLTEHRYIARLMAGLGPAQKKPLTAKHLISGLLRTVRKELALRSIILYLWSEEESAYTATEAYGFKRKQPMLTGRWARFAVGEGLVGQAAATGQPVVKELQESDIELDPYFKHLKANMKVPPLRLCIAFPLGSQQAATQPSRPFGVMLLADDSSGLLDPDRPFQSAAGAVLSGLGQRIQLYIDWLRLDEKRTGVLLSSAHQLLQPIAAVGGWIETIAIAGPSPSHLQSARASVVQAQHMANVQVHANRIAMGFASSAVKNIDLCALAKDAVDIYQPLATKKGIQLIADCARDRVRVTTSPTKARAVLDNLCSNALEYCHAGQSVKVSVQSSRNEIRLVVEDTGPGIRADLVRRFSRGELSVLSPHGSEGRGLGMGLAIVQDYARDLKWNCSLTTEKGMGTKFAFVIPATILRN